MPNARRWGLHSIIEVESFNLLGPARVEAASPDSYRGYSGRPEVAGQILLANTEIREDIA